MQIMGEESIFIWGFVSSYKGVESLLLSEHPVKEAQIAPWDLHSSRKIDSFIEWKLDSFNEMKGDSVFKSAVLRLSLDLFPQGSRKTYIN